MTDCGTLPTTDLLKEKTDEIYILVVFFAISVLKVY